MDEREAKEFAERHNGTYIGPSLCDIDLVYCRQRLWSIRDSLILYQITSYSETRARRLPSGFGDLGGR